MSIIIKPVHIIIAICILGFISGEASSQAATLKSPGIWCDRSSINSVPEQHEKRLTESLRRITGLTDIGFSQDGSLSLGDTSMTDGGSAAARELLLRVLRSGIVFIIEDHSGSETVNFGQLDKGEIHTHASRPGRVVVQRARLDFADFCEMQASREVRATFDEGFTLLHELLHGLGYTDPPDRKDIGECEEIVNRARTELGLLIRDRYFGDPVRLTTGVTTVRLRFRSPATDTDEAGRERHYLFFLMRTKPVPASSGQRVAQCSQ